MIQDHVDSLLVRRLETLKRARAGGTKVVGYFPGGYVPEELIYASGAIPLCLSHGGDPRVADEGLSILPHVICPFARAQVGEMRLQTNPFYASLDLLVVPSTCQHFRKIADVLEYAHPTEVFKLAVPYDPADVFSLEYFADRLLELKERLGRLTGNEPTDDSIDEAIAVYNRLRGGLKSISLLRRDPRYRLDALDFARLNHASCYADPVEMADALAAVYDELTEGEPTGRDGRPRLLLIGPNLALGDYDILRIVDTAGGNVVVEDVFEGVRDYWHTIVPGPDPIGTLVDGYLLEKTPRMFMRRSTRERLKHVMRLVEDFDVSGVIWYGLVCCEIYDQESYLFESRFREAGVPVLILESDYGGLRSGPVQTRVEAFLEIVAGGPVNA